MQEYWYYIVTKQDSMELGEGERGGYGVIRSCSPPLFVSSPNAIHYMG